MLVCSSNYLQHAFRAVRATSLCISRGSNYLDTTQHGTDSKVCYLFSNEHDELQTSKGPAENSGTVTDRYGCRVHVVSGFGHAQRESYSR